MALTCSVFLKKQKDTNFQFSYQVGKYNYYINTI